MDYAFFWLCTISLIICFQHVDCWYYKGNNINSYLDPREKPFGSKNKKHTSINLVQYYWDLFHPHYKYRQSTYFKFPIMEKINSHYLNEQLSCEPYPQNVKSRDHQVPALQSSYLYLPSSRRLFNPFFNVGKIDPTIIGSQYCYNNGIKKKRILSVPNKYKKKDIIYKANKEISPKTKFGERLIMPSKIVISNLSSWDSIKKNEIQSHNLSLSMIYNIKLTKVGDSTTNTNHNKKSTDYPFSGKGIEKVTYVTSIPKKSQLDFHCRRKFCQTTNILKSENNMNLAKPTVETERYKEEVRTEYKSYQTKKDILVEKKTTVLRYGTSCSVDKASSFKLRRESTPTPIIFRFDEYFCECKRTTHPKNKQIKITMKKNITTKSNTEKNEILEGKKSGLPHDISCTLFDRYSGKIDNSRYKRRTFKYKGKNNRKRAFVSMQTSNYNNNKTKLSSFRRISSLKNNYPQSNKIYKLKKNQLHSQKIINKSYKMRPQTYHRSKMGFKKINDKRRQCKREFVDEYKDDNNGTNYCEDVNEIMTTLMIYTDASDTTSILLTASPVPEDISSTEERTTTEAIADKSSAISEDTGVSTAILEGTIELTIPEGPNKSTKIPEGNEESSKIPDDTIEETTEISTTIAHKKLRPDTGNRHPAKLLCEEQYKVECVCQVASVLTEFNSMITNYDNQKLLVEQLKSYNCSNYKPMKVNYKLSPESKPRLLSNKHKELLVDDNNGPKEIIGETIQELMLNGIPNEGVDFYVFSSTNVEIPCFINNDIQLSPNTQDSATYVWRQGNNKVITGGRVTEDLNHRGMLQIVEATLADSDNYTCTVNYTNPDREQVISNSFIHSVMVVTLPKFALHTLLHYNAKVKCDQETLEMFDLYLPQQIEELICYIETDQRKICNVEIHNPMCLPKNLEVKNEGPKSVWKLQNLWSMQDVYGSQKNVDNRMEMSLNFELDLADISETMPSAANRTRCGPFCQLKVVLKLIEILRESFTVALTNEVSSSVGPTFEPDIKTINMKILIACEGGFQLIQGFCFPCPVNTFSKEGSTDCSQCPSGMFQPNIGSKSCEKCPNPFKNGCSALWMSPGVIALLVLFIILTIFISVLVFCGCKIIIGKCAYSCIYKMFKREKGMKPKDVLLRKLIRKKSLKTRLKHVDTSDPPTPPAEDFTS